MSDPDDPERKHGRDGQEPIQGVNLKLMYSLIALALLAAIVVAFFIVLPFYRRS